MSSSELTGLRLALAMQCSFCLAWNIAVAYELKVDEVKVEILKQIYY